MKATAPLYRKVYLNLDKEEPLTMWWTDKQIEGWDANKIQLFDFFRVETSPYAILEFRTNLFQGIEITHEIRHWRSPVVLNSTLYRQFILNVHSSEANYNNQCHLKYYNGIIGIYNRKLGSIDQYDLSDFEDFEILQNTSCGLIDLFSSTIQKRISGFNIKFVSFIEYSWDIV